MTLQEYMAAVNGLDVMRKRLQSGRKWIHPDRLREPTARELKGMMLLADKLDGLHPWRETGYWARRLESEGHWKRFAK